MNNKNQIVKIKDEWLPLWMLEMSEDPDYRDYLKRYRGSAEYQMIQLNKELSELVHSRLITRFLYWILRHLK